MTPEELEDENDPSFEELASAEGLTAREYFEKAIHRIYGIPREYRITEPFTRKPERNLEAHIIRGEE